MREQDRARGLQGEWLQLRAIRQLLDQRWLAVGLALALTGLAAATTVLVFQLGISSLGSWRIRLLADGPAWLVLSGFGAIGGLLAGLLIQTLAPEASGSGITQVMLFLRRRAVPIGLRIALVKLAAGILAIGSGLPLGPTGPAIQMGSSVAWSLARLLRAPQAFQRVIVAAGGEQASPPCSTPRSAGFSMRSRPCCGAPGRW